MLRDGLCPTVADVAAGLRMGAKIESLIPEGASVTYWQGLVNRFNNKAEKPKKRRKATKRATGHNKAGKTWSANQVIAGAILETVDRVNGLNN